MTHAPLLLQVPFLLCPPHQSTNKLMVHFWDQGTQKSTASPQAVQAGGGQRDVDHVLPLSRQEWGTNVKMKEWSRRNMQEEGNMIRT
jgi:hypothetical protein